MIHLDMQCKVNTSNVSINVAMYFLGAAYRKGTTHIANKTQLVCKHKWNYGTGYVFVKTHKHHGRNENQPSSTSAIRWVQMYSMIHSGSFESRCTHCCWCVSIGCTVSQSKPRQSFKPSSITFLQMTTGHVPASYYLQTRSIKITSLSRVIGVVKIRASKATNATCSDSLNTGAFIVKSTKLITRK